MAQFFSSAQVKYVCIYNLNKGDGGALIQCIVTRIIIILRI